MVRRGFIVSGTDTDVGKTVFAAGLTAALGADYWKPVQAGLEGETDSELVRRLTGPGSITIYPEAYRLNTPCSPHEAARLDGTQIDLGRLTLPEGQAPIIVEGAGGVLVPHAKGLLAADIFAHWGLPVILVARTALGTISHSLLSLEALRSRNIPVAGVAFMGPEDNAAQQAVVEFGQCPDLGRLPWLDPLDQQSLAGAFARHINAGLLA